MKHCAYVIEIKVLGKIVSEDIDILKTKSQNRIIQLIPKTKHNKLIQIIFYILILFDKVSKALSTKSFIFSTKNKQFIIFFLFLSSTNENTISICGKNHLYKPYKPMKNESQLHSQMLRQTAS